MTRSLGADERPGPMGDTQAPIDTTARGCAARCGCATSPSPTPTCSTQRTDDGAPTTISGWPTIRPVDPDGAKRPRRAGRRRTADRHGRLASRDVPAQPRVVGVQLGPIELIPEARGRGYVDRSPGAARRLPLRHHRRASRRRPISATSRSNARSRGPACVARASPAARSSGRAPITTSSCSPCCANESREANGLARPRVRGHGSCTRPRTSHLPGL